MSKEFLRGWRLESDGGVEGWWRCGEGGLDRVVKRYAIDDYNAANYAVWLEKAGVVDGPTTEVKPLGWWRGFWEKGL